MSKLRQYLKMAAQNAVLPFWYRLFAHGRVPEGTVLFADAHHDIRPQNMDLLWHTMNKEPGLDISEMYLDFSKASFLKTLFFYWPTTLRS